MNKITKTKRKAVYIVLAYILVIVCAFTGCKKEDVNTAGDSKKNEVDKENEVKREPVPYNFEGVLKKTQSIISIGALDNHKTIYLSGNEYLDEKTRKNYLMTLEEQDGAWNVVNEYEIKLAENESLGKSFLSGDGKTYIYNVFIKVEEKEDTGMYESKTYIAEIKNDEMTSGEVVNIENMNNGLSVALEYSIDKDNCEINILGVTGNTMYLTVFSEIPTNAVSKNETSKEEEASDQYVYLYATMDINSKNITILKNFTEYERFTDLEGVDSMDSLIVRESVYQNEKGNIELLYLYKDTSEETWEVTYEYDIDKKEMEKISNQKVQNLLFLGDYEEYNFDNIFFTGIGNGGSDLYYILNREGGLSICSLSLDAIKQGDADIVQETSEEEYKGTEYDKYDVSDFEAVTRNKTEKSKKAGIYYEIFVRAFADSDGDGIGDLNGVTQKLDYLKDLGVEGIWLMPINASSSYHGYDINDYYAVNPDYGTEEDLENLVKEAHKRGIKVIMDLVLNHTGKDNAWFQDAITGEDSKYRNYYRWTVKEDKLDYDKNMRNLYGSSVWNKVGDAYYYAIFGADMPDLNYNNPDVRAEMKQVAKKYLEMGLDGFRLDAAIHVYGQGEFAQMKDRDGANLQWWNEFGEYCETINPNVYIVGEAWEDDNTFAEYAKPFDSKFDFAFQENMINAIQQEKAVTKDGANLAKSLEEILKEYDKYDTNFIDAIFAANHDQDRLMSQVETEEKVKLAVNIYMTLSGNPFLYYGEELGMKGSGSDEYKRTGFLWGEKKKQSDTTWIEDSANKDTKSFAVQSKDKNSLYHYYKKIIEARKSSDALKYGDFKAIDISNDAVMAYTRSYKNETVSTLHNLSGKKVTISIKGAASCKVLFAGSKDYSIKGDKVTLGAYTSIILK